MNENVCKLTLGTFLTLYNKSKLEEENESKIDTFKLIDFN